MKPGEDWGQGEAAVTALNRHGPSGLLVSRTLPSDMLVKRIFHFPESLLMQLSLGVAPLMP